MQVMSADEPDKPEKPLEGSEEVLFDELVAGYRVVPKTQAESAGSAEAAFMHAPRTPKGVVDTLPPNLEPPVVLNITQPLTVVPRIYEAAPDPVRSPEDNLTFPLPERRVRRLRSKLTVAALVAAGLVGFGFLVRWSTMRSVVTPHDVPSGATAAATARALPVSAASTVAATPTPQPAVPSATAVPIPVASSQAPPRPTASATTAAPRPARTAPTAELPRPPPAIAPPPPPPIAPAPPPPVPAVAPATTAKPKDDVSRTF